MRKPKISGLPPSVYVHKRSGVAESFIIKRLNSTKVLCKINATLDEVWEAYERELQTTSLDYSINRLTIDYLGSQNFKDLAPRTQKDRIREIQNLVKVFGEMKPDHVEPRHIRQYMDTRGEQSKTQANHELSAASVVFGWGYERGFCKTNPVKGIKRYKRNDRERYINDTEYDALLACAGIRLYIACEISYLCAARQGDVLELTWSQITEDGIYIKQGKTGKKQVKAWSPRLKKVIDEAKLLQGNVASPYVINKSEGGLLTGDGLRSAWKRAMVKVKNDFPCIERSFTFHDLKAKGISDFEGTLAEKQQFSGHKTLAQVNTYDRKVTVVPTIGSNSK